MQKIQHTSPTSVGLKQFGPPPNKLWAIGFEVLVCWKAAGHQQEAAKLKQPDATTRRNLPDFTRYNSAPANGCYGVAVSSSGSSHVSQTLDFVKQIMMHVVALIKRISSMR